MVDNLLPEYVELPHVLDLAVHLDVILVSAQVPIGPFDLGLLWVWDWVGLGLGLGLDNCPEHQTVKLN